MLCIVVTRVLFGRAGYGWSTT